jgi:hypothetical protein
MNERREFKRLIIATLDTTGNMRAVTLYDKIRREDPKILRTEKVNGLRSFVKVINQIPEVQHTGTMIKRYSLRFGNLK